MRMIMMMTVLMMTITMMMMLMMMMTLMITLIVMTMMMMMMTPPPQWKLSVFKLNPLFELSEEDTSAILFNHVIESNANAMLSQYGLLLCSACPVSCRAPIGQQCQQRSRDTCSLVGRRCHQGRDTRPLVGCRCHRPCPASRCHHTTPRPPPSVTSHPPQCHHTDTWCPCLCLLHVFPL